MLRLVLRKMAKATLRFFDSSLAMAPGLLSLVVHDAGIVNFLARRGRWYGN
jgi:hypothetical protein